MVYNYLYSVLIKSLQLIVKKECFDLALMWVIIGLFFRGHINTCIQSSLDLSEHLLPLTKNICMASLAMPPHDLLIELAILTLTPTYFNATLTITQGVDDLIQSHK